MNYYMISVNNKEGRKHDIFINPKRSVKDVFSSIDWMRQGGFEDDYRCVKRVSKLNFECVKTKEIFTIDENNRGAYTVEAWTNFINKF